MTATGRASTLRSTAAAARSSLCLGTARRLSARPSRSQSAPSCPRYSADHGGGELAIPVALLTTSPRPGSADEFGRRRLANVPTADESVRHPRTKKKLGNFNAFSPRAVPEVAAVWRYSRTSRWR
jgi:hypothetical protein